MISSWKTSLELEKKVNEVLQENHTLKSYYIPEEEFQQRSDLLKTSEAKPPVSNGQVRVVEIESFDAQAGVERTCTTPMK